MLIALTAGVGVWVASGGANGSSPPIVAAGNPLDVPTQVVGTPSFSISDARNVLVESVSCTSPGNCSAGGNYSSLQSGTQAFIVNKTNGTWGRAIEVPGISSLFPGGSSVLSVSCSSPGNCSAGGTAHFQSFLVSEVNGEWDKAVAVSGEVSDLSTGIDWFRSISCPTPGNCSAIGVYDFGTFAVNETNGTWSPAVVLGGINSGSQRGELTSISCGAPGDCSAGGTTPGGLGGLGNHERAIVADESNGAWGHTTLIQGSGTADVSHFSFVETVSCYAVGDCIAGGKATAKRVGKYFFDGPSFAFVANEVQGVWGRAIAVPGLAHDSWHRGTAVNSVSCASTGNCSVGGEYSTKDNSTGSFVVSETNGVWGRPVYVPRSNGAEVSCASPGNCSAGGEYSIYKRSSAAFVISEVGGRWGKVHKVSGNGEQWLWIRNHHATPILRLRFGQQLHCGLIATPCTMSHAVIVTGGRS